MLTRKQFTMHTRQTEFNAFGVTDGNFSRFLTKKKIHC